MSSDIYLENLEAKIAELKASSDRLSAEQNQIQGEHGALIANFEKLWDQVELAGKMVETIENKAVRSGRPRAMSRTEQYEKFGGHRLIIPYTPEARRWEPNGYTPESTAIRQQMINDIEQLRLQWSMYWAPRNRIHELVEEIIAVNRDKSALEQLCEQYLRRMKTK